MAFKNLEGAPAHRAHTIGDRAPMEEELFKIFDGIGVWWYAGAYRGSGGWGAPT